MRYLAFLLFVLAAPAAFAQCNPNVPGGVPFNCAAGANPGLADLFLGGSRTGNTNGETVAFTGAQLVGMAGQAMTAAVKAEHFHPGGARA